MTRQLLETRPDSFISDAGGDGGDEGSNQSYNADGDDDDG